MAYCDDADVRRRLLQEFTDRAYPENIPVLKRLLALRYEFAASLGYPGYAAYALEDKMMQTPVAAAAFLHRIGDLTRPAALQDLAQLLERKRKDDPAATRIENWDIGVFADGYYSSKIRTEEFGVDLKKLRAYLPYGQVRDGLFDLCRELFGLRFVACRTVELWHPTVEAFDVLRAEEPIGRFYLDMVPRGKVQPRGLLRGARRARRRPASTERARLQLPRPVRGPAQCADGVWRRRHVLPLVRPFIARDALRPRPLAVQFPVADRMGLRRGALPALRGVGQGSCDSVRRFARNPDTGESRPVELLDRMKASEAFGRPSRWIRQVALSEASLRSMRGTRRAPTPPR